MWSRVILVVFVVLLAGCSQSVDEVDNAAWRGDPEVSGIVTLDAEPLAGAQVSFDPAAGVSLVTMTDETGRFSLDLTDASESIIGKYAVRIWHPESEAAGNKDSGENEVPRRYNRETELVVDIRDGENSFEFRLTSSKLTDE